MTILTTIAQYTGLAFAAAFFVALVVSCFAPLFERRDDTRGDLPEREG